MVQFYAATILRFVSWPLPMDSHLKLDFSSFPSPESKTLSRPAPLAFTPSALMFVKTILGSRSRLKTVNSPQQPPRASYKTSHWPFWTTTWRASTQIWRLRLRYSMLFPKMVVSWLPCQNGIPRLWKTPFMSPMYQHLPTQGKWSARGYQVSRWQSPLIFIAFSSKMKRAMNLKSCFSSPVCLKISQREPSWSSQLTKFEARRLQRSRLDLPSQP